MSSLIIMAVYDTEENGRTEYTIKTLESLRKTVDWTKHTLIIVDNNSCEATKKALHNTILGVFANIELTAIKPTIITNTENVGTAKAINQGLAQRLPGVHCIKIDNDVVIHQSGWVEEMEEVIERDQTIGIVGLKRKDINFDPNNENPAYRSTLIGLRHAPGQRWITVEGGGQIMGTCTMFNWRLVDKINAMMQVGVYGMDDVLYDLRSQLAGFWNCYLPHIDISHIDTGENPYTQLKHKQASESWQEYAALHEAYKNGSRPLWEDF